MGSLLSRSVEVQISNNTRKTILKNPRMGSLVSHSVEIRICNKTRNITLKNPRIHSRSQHSSHSIIPEVPPGSREIWHFQSSSWFCDASGILVYEAESFTLTLLFSNPMDSPMDYQRPMELALELSPGTAHPGRLEDILTRREDVTYPPARLDTEMESVIVDRNHGTVQVSHGPVKVMATMSYASDSLLEVVLEEEEGW